MNMTFNGADGAIFFIATSLSVLTMLFWMYIGWRAMRAHEKLAQAANQIARSDTRNFLARLTEKRADSATPPA